MQKRIQPAAPLTGKSAPESSHSGISTRFTMAWNACVLPNAIVTVPGDTETLMVLDAIRQLPDAYRDTLLMRLVEGMSGQEIAERTGLSPGSVRVNLHRGMKLLREKLGMHGHE